ncbi:hypothetical protein IFM89_007995 [Coptis chinensis]|uniref:Uncharacterized protein n=1 Tax=Coptis chinensis TaxID=261450 RepID=A0A835MAD1_9MAGN|nr:hypothetical protein IFM89_007995 [Coptis chinensis]
MVSSETILNVTQKSLVMANNTSIKHYTLPISNLDLLSGRSAMIVLFAYTKPPVGDFSSILSTIKTSLSETLNHYFPFAGRVVSNSATNEAEILCNNQGVEVTESHANIDLASFHDLNESVKDIYIPVSLEMPLSLQVTSFTCGGFSLFWSFDHVLVDAKSSNTFLVAWSEVARKRPISNYPNHQRSIFKPRSPPPDEKMYFIEASDVIKLQELASENGEKRTKVEAVSAYIWKVVAATLEESETHCNMGWLVDGRPRIVSQDVSNLVGNVLSMAVGEASVEDLRQGTLSKVATIAHRAICEVTNEEHFLDLIDWIESHKPGMFLAKILLGIGGPSVIVTSGRQYSLFEVNMGFGPPVVGTYYSSLQRLCAAFFNPQPSSRGDGSWVVFSMVWSKLADALESDPNQIFKPISATI